MTDYDPIEVRILERYAREKRLGVAQGALPKEVAKDLRNKWGSIIANCPNDEIAYDILNNPDTGVQATHPHLFFTAAGGHVDDAVFEPVAVETELLGRAFGAAPTMRARGEVLLKITAEVARVMGKDAKPAAVNAEASRQFNELALSWGASDRNLRPGINPNDVPPPRNDRGRFEAPPQKETSNPWREGPGGWVGTDAQRIAAKAKLLRSLGSKACEGLAKSAGVSLLSGRPL